MPDRNHTTPAYDLLLLGGGHSHLQVLRTLVLPQCRIALIDRATHMAYSGMLPGLIAGHYHPHDCHIDLRALCEQAGVQFVQAEVRALDLPRRRVHCTDGTALDFALLSIDTGAVPALPEIAGADRFGAAVKPIEAFLPWWAQLQRDLLTAHTHFHIAV